MAADPNLIEQAVSRALRENLSRIQRGSDEVQHAINDLVSACASSRPTNAWPAMVRAQASAASLSASLEVLTRFVAATCQSLSQSQIQPMGSTPEFSEPIATPVPVPFAPEPVAPEPVEPKLFVPQPLTPQPTGVDLPLEEPSASPIEPYGEETIVPPTGAVSGLFDVSSLPGDMQEMHRRAFRVAKVAMQDIKLIHPDDVRAGRESKDLCARLRIDIEKAHTEYVRRFEPILSHPVDYFYDWMVEILAEGDPTALGEYPYPSAVLHR